MKYFFTLFLLTPFLLPAQNSGPGGVGNSTYNSLWLSANNNCYTNAGTTLATNNNAVEQWNDRSGNAKNAIQTTTANKPVYKTNGLNGLATLVFNGTTSGIASQNLTTSSNPSFFVVAKYLDWGTTTNGNPGLLQGSPSGNGYSAATANKIVGMWTNRTSQMIWGRGRQSNATARDIPQTTALNLNQFYVISQIFSGTNIQQYVNGAAAGNVSYDGTLGTWADLRIGGQAAEALNGEMAEVIMFNTPINFAQRIIIENYLAAKYGLTLSGSDVYTQDNPANGNYDYDVAGIGRSDANNIHNDATGSIVRILNPSNLTDNKFLIWGHNNGTLSATNVDTPYLVRARMGRVWRINEANAAGLAVDIGSVDIQFDLTGLGPVTASDLRLIVDTDNDGFFYDETPISGAMAIGGNMYQFTGVTALANNLRFTLGTANSAQTPLPITLKDFNVALINDYKVQINWTTIMETNKGTFTVEKSKDTRTWETVTSQFTEGNSYSLKKYETIDNNPFIGVNYYRLKITDEGGKISYSEIKSIRTKSDGIRVAPNPAKTETYIYGITDTKSLRIYNNLGTDVTSLVRLQNAGSTTCLNLSKLPSGLYFIKSNERTARLFKE